MSIEIPKQCWMCNELREFMFCTMKAPNGQTELEICSNKCFMAYKVSKERADAFNLAVMVSPAVTTMNTIGKVKPIAVALKTIHVNAKQDDKKKSGK